MDSIVYVRFSEYFDGESHERGAFIPVKDADHCFSEALIALEEYYGNEVECINSMEYIDMSMDFSDERAEKVWALMKEEYDG